MKGGTLINYEGKLRLLEVAQVPKVSLGGESSKKMKPAGKKMKWEKGKEKGKQFPVAFNIGAV